MKLQMQQEKVSSSNVSRAATKNTKFQNWFNWQCISHSRMAENWAMVQCRVYQWWPVHQFVMIRHWICTDSKSHHINRHGKHWPIMRWMPIWTATAWAHIAIQHFNIYSIRYAITDFEPNAARHRPFNIIALIQFVCRCTATIRVECQQCIKAIICIIRTMVHHLMPSDTIRTAPIHMWHTLKAMIVCRPAHNHNKENMQPFSALSLNTISICFFSFSYLE